ncbi:MAG TPA: DUF934 domain-containing protein [Beijerinckia sp.]|jgi:uncharacterized protein (DUF934 family)|nr:DUF934 domain-containing protein [Beijerinckia sp.]
MAYFKDGAFQEDIWRRLGEGEELPQEGHIILTLKAWQGWPEQKKTNVAFGLLLEPGTKIEALVADLPRLSLVLINFPKFTDGRGYSMAREIRDYYGYKGELRATGDILFDQLQYLARCGFDAFEITDPATLKLLDAGRRPDFGRFYQPALGPEAVVDTRPWARRQSSSTKPSS